MSVPPSPLTPPSDPLAKGSAAGSPRVLIARMSAIGDTILTLPVACRLREAFPHAFLAWVVEEKSAAFVVGHPVLDEVIVVPRGWFTKPAEIVALRRRLRPLRLQTALDCQGLTKSALACWLSGASRRIGFAGAHGGELSPWLNNRLVTNRHPHVTDRSLELLGEVGLAGLVGKPGVRWDVPIPAEAVTSVAAKLPSWAQARSFAVINPGATWDSKLWSMDRFGSLAARLGETLGMKTLVVWGGKRELNDAQHIANNSDGWAELAPATTLRELAAVLSLARLVVSSDTGPMHLAVAVGAPTVGLHGATRPQDCGPYGAPHLGLLKQFQAGGRRERRQADNSAMLAISVDDAWHACRQVLERSAMPTDSLRIAKAS
ncbi:glycosyltransferase family 9 protein [Botrimarina hoheduenensis]|uniref:Lipopolysaccharide heptosyltransferase 1 n=1 Tax=Botrimarina hoheduenensis TaxID=2528000 RepID=A0A5C5VUW2_9BACT|nr:glycosyltransferase family 9 protein [Botrimarina hoheduenensis]TWT41439.1 Lipopolysaccharide heptosyltransferase 1 [Botrimarina hoheduenensis]